MTVNGGARLVRIERGSATEEELAALVVALQRALDTHTHQRTPAPAGRWAASARPRPGRLPRPGPDAWRTSALPR